ncbi:MAG: putative toxin-antitoxin system toxin component, PIN family [Bryobacteraceae bacterium]
MKILLDTNLLVRAAISPAGSAREILRSIESDEEHELVISRYLLGGVADVLRRDRIRARWPLTDEEVAAFCRFLSLVGREVSPEPLPHIIEDPKDQVVIETAVAGAANVICTLDAHFYKAKVSAFCSAHSIRVLNDTELLRLLAVNR